MAAWDPTQWGVFFGAVAVLIGAIAAGAVTIINAMNGVSGKVDALEVKVDGRLTQLLERTASSSRAEGVVAGRGEVVQPGQAGPSPIAAEGDHLVVPVPIPTPPILILPVEKEREGRP